MRFFLILLLSAAVVAVTAVRSFAEERYYIELGDEGSRAEAVSQWEAFSQKFSDLLSGLSFFPGVVEKADRTKMVRVHAGPIAEKEQAQKICNDLFAQETPCFVLEGVDYPYRTAGLFELPWRSQAPLPWLSAPASGEAKVEVAEAIRVPLSDVPDADLQPQINPVFSEAMEELPPETVVEVKAGWLNVRPFESEESAADLWRRVRDIAPERAAGLSVRVARPFMAEEEGAPVALTVGPFADADTAMKLCEKGFLALSGTLSCQYAPASPPEARIAPLLAVSR